MARRTATKCLPGDPCTFYTLSPPQARNVLKKPKPKQKTQTYTDPFTLPKKFKFLNGARSLAKTVLSSAKPHGSPPLEYMASARAKSEHHNNRTYSGPYSGTKIAAYFTKVPERTKVDVEASESSRRPINRTLSGSSKRINRRNNSWAERRAQCTSGPGANPTGEDSHASMFLQAPRYHLPHDDSSSTPFSSTPDINLHTHTNRRLPFSTEHVRSEMSSDSAFDADLDSERETISTGDSDGLWSEIDDILSRMADTIKQHRRVSKRGSRDPSFTGRDDVKDRKAPDPADALATDRNSSSATSIPLVPCVAARAADFSSPPACYRSLADVPLRIRNILDHTPKPSPHCRPSFRRPCMSQRASLPMHQDVSRVFHAFRDQSQDSFDYEQQYNDTDSVLSFGITRESSLLFH